jgi:hypothetical protein
MFIAKHPITPNAAAELTPFGITAPQRKWHQK